MKDQNGREYYYQMAQNRKGFYFEEFKEHEGNCRFNGCVHVNEPDCSVKKALADGQISKRRYQSYIEIFDELKNKKKY